jgi:protein-L-isoaspartate(D-aspartate) O-methyltransferase
MVEEDGGLGYPERSPYDSICITAACPGIPHPLIEQLGKGGRLIAPVRERGIQELVLLEKSGQGLRREVITEVLYVLLKGKYG